MKRRHAEAVALLTRAVELLTGNAPEKAPTRRAFRKLTYEELCKSIGIRPHDLKLRCLPGGRDAL